MALVVTKYGGTSVGSIDKIRNVARRLIETKKKKGTTWWSCSRPWPGDGPFAASGPGDDGKSQSPGTGCAGSTGGTGYRGPSSAWPCRAWATRPRPLLVSSPPSITDHGLLGGPASATTVARRIMGRAVRKGHKMSWPWPASRAGRAGEHHRPWAGRVGHDRRWPCAAALKANVCEIFTDVEGVHTTDPGCAPKPADEKGLLRGDAGKWPAWGTGRTIRSVEIRQK